MGILWQNAQLKIQPKNFFFLRQICAFVVPSYGDEGESEKKAKAVEIERESKSNESEAFGRLKSILYLEKSSGILLVLDKQLNVAGSTERNEWKLEKAFWCYSSSFSISSILYGESRRMRNS